jgi:dihydrofolate reductase
MLSLVIADPHSLPGVARFRAGADVAASHGTGGPRRRFTRPPPLTQPCGCHIVLLQLQGCHIEQTEAPVRRLIAAMKISVDGKMEGPEGYADWVDAWSDDYELTAQVDACVLGGRMYPGYEQYWTAIRNAPDQPHPLSGQVPTPAEVAWAEFAARTPHYVLSTSLSTAGWPGVRFLRGIDDVAALKQQEGKDVYLMGGAVVTDALIEAGLVDELRLIVYPLVVGDGRPLFPATSKRRPLELLSVGRLPNGRVSLRYAVGGDRG